jgi:hypothetical protein
MSKTYFWQIENPVWQSSIFVGKLAISV